MKKEYNARNLLSGFAPGTFLKPVILISTVFGKANQEKSTAICFGEALNRFHLMEKVFVQEKCYERAGWGDPRKDVSDFIVIKKHKTWKAACRYHIELIRMLNNDYYFRLYNKYCPKEMRRERD